MHEGLSPDAEAQQPIRVSRFISRVTSHLVVLAHVWMNRRWDYAVPLLAIVLSVFLLSDPATADSADRWQTLTDAGNVAREQARYKEAEQFFVMADQEAQGFSSTDGRRGSSLNNLGLVFHDQGQYERAQACYEEALLLWERAFGPIHEDAAVALHNLAEIYQEQGKLEQAEDYYGRSLSIGERVFGPGHPKLAVGYNGLGMLYRRQGRQVHAEASFHLALTMAGNSEGAEVADTAVILNNLASLYKEKELYAFAEPLYQRALNLRRTILGASHPGVAMSLNNLANLYHAQGLSELADRRYREAFAVLEAMQDPPSRLMGSILGNWALLAHERGLLEEAKLRYERALVLQQQTLGGRHPMVATLRDRYAGLLRTLEGEFRRGALPQGPQPPIPLGANGLAQAVDVGNTR
ncbi:MAG: tetratricopeptide repeat protein [Nitrospira sp.]